MGFLFPSLAGGTTQANHMNQNAIEYEEAPPDLPVSAFEQHVVSALSGIYLNAGLPLEFAVRAALADYECSFNDHSDYRS